MFTLRKPCAAAHACEWRYLSHHQPGPHAAVCERCILLVVSAQGCGFRSTRPVQLETPIMISDLPNSGTAMARVANCLPLGNDGKYFLIGAALYNAGNVWGIADPPEDWNVAAKNDPVAAKPRLR